MAIIADGGIPIDGSTESVKVKTINDIEFEEPMFRAILDLTAINSAMLEQLTLLNIRFEEAFNTGLDEGDL